ncbi:MAG: porin family protein [Nitrospira sp.]|nr:porin family protein [Nitrospira sp.]
MLGFLGLAATAQAEEGIRVRPIDVYISGFAGYSFPFKTDFSYQGTTLISDLELDKSPSFGGKAGMWFTAPRKRLGIDIGVEADVTNFNPDTPRTLELQATYFGVHVLARVPMEVTQELPNGRWFPYVGFGGGGQRIAFEAPGTTEGRHTAPAFHGLWGAKVFITKHIALFGEGKYTHASHTLTFQNPFSTADFDLTVRALHGVGGLSVHF